MNQSKPKKHHFLFYVFKADKEKKAMPSGTAKGVLEYLKHVFTEKSKKGRI